MEGCPAPRGVHIRTHSAKVFYSFVAQYNLAHIIFAMEFRVLQAECRLVQERGRTLVQSALRLRPDERICLGNGERELDQRTRKEHLRGPVDYIVSIRLSFF